MKNSHSQKGGAQVAIFLVIMVLLVASFIGFLVTASSDKDNQAPSNSVAGDSYQNSQINSSGQKTDFFGDRGDTLQANDNQVFIDEAKVSDGNLHAFNLYSETAGKTLYFFIVQASDGTYRAAANACEVCFGSRTGFSQVGDQIRCENCRTMYTKDQIALEKGGCNPRPISRNVELVNGQLVLNLAEIEKIADLF